MRIDLGCGKNKFRDCIGIDKINYPGTDIVCDINQRLPFDDNSVDFVMASQSLQYVDDLEAVMEEIYRICRHKAVVCIVAPYAHVTPHIVNPQYKQLFNEHSPRYWTKHTGMMLDNDEFLFSSTDKWSLQDEESSLHIDFRVLRMEFFYFSAFKSGYEPFELALLRQSQLNVAFQIMYQLLVVKEPISDDDILMLKESIWFEEPDYIKVQRGLNFGETVEEPPFQLEHLSPILRSRKSDIEIPVKRQVLKRDPRNRSTFTHRVKTVRKKRRYRRSRR